MTALKRIGILGHPKRPHTAPVGERIAASLSLHGLQTWHYSEWQEADVGEAVRESDLVIAIGGDGAMFRAARVCAPYDVPVLGLNMGRLGFLTEIASPEDWEDHIEPLLAGNYWIERRMMISARVNRKDGPPIEDVALNDVVLSGNSPGSMVQLESYIDGYWTTTYSCDALIISTPTGSSAYALAAGGPILPPDLSNILIIPVAPHLSMDRSIVLSEGSQVAVRLHHGNRSDVTVKVDGRLLAKLNKNDIIYVTANDYYSSFVRMREPNYFYRSLLDRLEPRVNSNTPEHIKTLKEIEDQL